MTSVSIKYIEPVKEHTSRISIAWMCIDQSESLSRKGVRHRAKSRVYGLTNGMGLAILEQVAVFEVLEHKIWAKISQ